MKNGPRKLKSNTYFQCEVLFHLNELLAVIFKATKVSKVYFTVYSSRPLL